MERLETIYKKTYNFVYLRAKSILKKEEDIQQLMKEVYGKVTTQDFAEDKLYEWLANEVYTVGCNKFRKKKVRETQFIELEAEQYETREMVNKEQTKIIICEALENLPDMYLATVFALCYDHMKIKDIVGVMGYNSGAIINRLNYVNKYLEKSVENYREEQGEEVQFSIELLCEALSAWCKDCRMTETVAQNVYASICREKGMVAESICEEGESAGLECRANETDGFRFVCEELQSYCQKKRTNNKPTGLLFGIGGLAILLTAGVLLAGNFIKKEEENLEKPVVEQEKTNDNADEQVVENDVESEEEKTEEQEEVQEVVPQENATQSDSGYILPKSDKEKLTRADLEGLTKEQLRLARNEIYARHGMIFGVSDLDNYFATKSWYKPTIPFGEFEDKVEMSIVEEQNIILIQQVEKEK